MTTTETTEALWARINRRMKDCAPLTPPAQGCEFRWVPFEPNEARARYAAIPETSTEGSRWYVWKSGYGPNYIGGKIASKADAERIAAELNMLSAIPDASPGGGEQCLIGHRADMWCIGCMEDGPFARVVPAMPGGKFGTESFASAATVHDALRLALETANLFRPKDFVSEINPLSIRADPTAPTADRLREAAQFLLDRLDSLEWMDDGYADVQRDFFGHVEPAMGRLRAALSDAGEERA